jgi:hypothetical protein
MRGFQEEPWRFRSIRFWRIHGAPLGETRGVGDSDEKAEWVATMLLRHVSHSALCSSTAHANCNYPA